MRPEEKKAYKARQLRYKKPISKFLNYESITDELWDMQAECEDIHWYDNDQDSLVNALDGDEDEAYEFKMAFSDLEAELEQFQEDLSNEYIPEYFDTFFPAVGADFAGGYLGYDQYEGDYFGIQPYEYAWAEDEAAKKIMTMTKKQMLEAVGLCLKVANTYLAVRYRYDCLKSAIDILRGENLDKIKAVKGVEEQYVIAEEHSHHFEYEYDGEVRKLDRMLNEIPQEYWIQ